MNKARRFTNRFRQIRGERDNIVVGSLFNLVDTRDGKFRATLDLFERFARNRAHLGVDFADGDFHVQPFLEPGLFRPERAHFGQCVSVNHSFAGFKFQVSSFSVKLETYFSWSEVTKYLARYQRPPCSSSVSVSIPSPCSNEVR